MSFISDTTELQREYRSKETEPFLFENFVPRDSDSLPEYVTYSSVQILNAVSQGLTRLATYVSSSLVPGPVRLSPTSYLLSRTCWTIFLFPQSTRRHLAFLETTTSSARCNLLQPIHPSSKNFDCLSALVDTKLKYSSTQVQLTFVSNMSVTGVKIYEM